MRQNLLCSIINIAVVLLLAAYCASATLWISVLGGHRAKLTNNEGGHQIPPSDFLKTVTKLPAEVKHEEQLRQPHWLVSALAG